MAISVVFRIWHRVRTRGIAGKDLSLLPVVAPDSQRAGVRVAEKRQPIHRQPEYLRGGNGFRPAAFTEGDVLLGAQMQRWLEELEGDLIVVAVGEVDDADVG